MLRDTTGIDFGAGTGCVNILDDQTMIYYNAVDSGSYNTTYKLINDKWFAVSKELSADNPQPDNVICIDPGIFLNLPSRYDEFTPIYTTTAIISAILIFYAAYKLIIYPFFRKR